MTSRLATHKDKAQQGRDELSRIALERQERERLQAASRPKRSAPQQALYLARSRPLIGALILALGGYFVISPVIGSLSMVAGMGAGGISIYVIGGGMIAAAAVAVAAPAQRHFPAIMAMILSVASLPLANLGGWIIGMVCGIIGAGMVFAWTPYTEEQLAEFARRHARRAARTSVGARKAPRVEGATGQ